MTPLHRVGQSGRSQVHSPNDVAILANESVADTIARYHDTMARLTNRADVRNDASRYEAVGLALGNTVAATRGELLTAFPAAESGLAFAKFFPTLYRAYDLRFVYAAPALKGVTQRLEWAADSPAIELPLTKGLTPRIG